MIKRFVLPIASILGFGCLAGPDEETTVAKAPTLHVRSTVSGGEDVAGIEFDVLPLDCVDGAPTGPSTTQIQPLGDALPPEGIGGLEAAPLVRGFADAFLTLPAGCYGVSATPVTQNGVPSSVCYAACKTRVELFADQTTDLTIANECGRIDSGGLAAMISVLGQQRTRVQDIRFKMSKFPPCGELHGTPPCGPLR